LVALEEAPELAASGMGQVVLAKASAKAWVLVLVLEVPDCRNRCCSGKQ